KRTTLHIAEMTKDADHATGYQADGVAKEGFAAKPYREIAGMAPAGSINSSVKEMAKWIAFQLGQNAGGKASPLPGRKTLEMLHQPQMITASAPTGTKEVHSMGYAMGWGVESYRGHRHVEHGGAIDGFVAQVELFPDDNLGIVALVNQSGNGLPGVICPMIADRVLKMQPVDWSGQALQQMTAAKALKKQAGDAGKLKVEGTRPSHDLKAFEGVFDNPGYGQIAFELNENKIRVKYGIVSFGLEHWHYDQFRPTGLKPEDDAFQNKRFLYETDAAGDISAVSIDLEPMTPPIVFKRAADSRLADENFLQSLVGEYELQTQVLGIVRQGRQLQVSLPGQPVYRLVSEKGLKFQFEGLPGFHVQFELTGKGEVSGLTVQQPDGNYSGKRKK
ncbi:MAG: DUF3471 domain-containing protein, partial [Isosphaeraceae bacterium]